MGVSNTRSHNVHIQYVHINTLNNICLHLVYPGTHLSCLWIGHIGLSSILNKLIYSPQIREKFSQNLHILSSNKGKVES
jgi:hypothetical protein